MKRNFLAFCLTGIFICQPLLAQVRYEMGLLLGFQHTLAQRGPQQETNVSEVKFLKPVTRSLGMSFDVKPNLHRLFYGIEFMWDDNSFGYQATSNDLNTSGSVSLTSGVMSSRDWIYVYKGGVRFGYSLYKRRKIEVTSVIIPSLGYYRYSQILSDTSGNSYWRIDMKEIQYISYPTWQRQGLYFLLKGTLQMQYNWTRHFATSFMMSYQQGFSPYVIDTMNIVRPYEPSGRQEHKYWTKINGTALQWHFGVKYVFE